MNTEGAHSCTENIITEKARALSKSLAVRSSGTMEDSSKASFAGLYESKLWVKPEEVSQALNQVMQSANPAKIEAYLTALKEPGGANKMHAIVQKMIRGAISGVGFSRHPFDSSDVLIEFTK